MKIEEGMYARTKNNGVCKLYREFHEESVDVGIGVFPEIDGFFIDKEEISYIEKEDIIKASKSIIDLVCIGDYVNGERIQFITNKKQFLTDGGYDIFGKYKDIKTILTKEQYENNCYRIEE